MVQPLLLAIRMWRVLSFLGTAAAVTACAQAPTTDPTVTVDEYWADTWFEGEQNQVHVEWLPELDCTNNGWSCSTGPTPWFTITSATCDGCTVTDVPSGEMGNAGAFHIEATTTGPITLSVTLESAGETRELQATAHGDREVALDVTCQTVRTDQLAPGVSEIEPALILPCGATHTADQTVVLAPQIVTANGTRYFPFCPDGATCGPDYPRKTSAITIAGATSAWNDFGFYTLADATAAHQVVVSAPLLDGSRSTVTVATPALETP